MCIKLSIIRNLLLDKTSSIKISDISLNKNEKRVLQMSKVVNYLSPELVREESYSENTDTWSFGCVVFELLHLKKAFDGNNQIEILNSILNTELVDFDALNLTETFDFILRHSLDRDKAARLTCTQMLKSLTGNVRYFIKGLKLFYYYFLFREKLKALIVASF